MPRKMQYPNSYYVRLDDTTSKAVRRKAKRQKLAPAVLLRSIIEDNVLNREGSDVRKES